MISKMAIESRAFLAARRIFGRYGVDVADPDVTEGALSAAMKRMNPKEYTVVIGAFAAVMAAHGRFLPPAPPKLAEAEMYDQLQARARHLANHHEDLPEPPSKVIN